MAITNGYASLAQIRALNDMDAGYTDDDALLERAVETASRMIDEYCGRRFYATAAATRYFTPKVEDYLDIPDLHALTTLKTGTGATWTQTWTLNTHFTLEPTYPIIEGTPWTQIRVTYNGALSFDPDVTRSVEIVGDWGWAAVPIAVEQACLLEANRIFHRGTAPFGTAGAVDTGTAFLRAALDPDVKKQLRPYRRLTVVVP